MPKRILPSVSFYLPFHAVHMISQHSIRTKDALPLLDLPYLTARGNNSRCANLYFTEVFQGGLRSEVKTLEASASGWG